MRTTDLLFGLAVGAVGTAFVSRYYWGRTFEHEYVAGVLGQIDVARSLKRGRADDLLARVEGSFPEYVRGIDIEFGRSEAALVALWTMKDYYETDAPPMPTEVAGVLGTLPPPPPDLL